MQAPTADIRMSWKGAIMPQKTAAVLLIGDELLSGRTRDVNLQTIAEFLGPMGINVIEARIVPDDHSRIADAVNDVRKSCDYVFTTGGIGPTHDDITADAVAAAFGVEISERADALAELERRYEASGVELTPARRRMARIPDGARLIANPVSGAPGFQLENVFVMAGVPKIARAMLEDVGPRLEGGERVLSRTVRAKAMREGDIGDALGALAKDMPDLSFGSYPWYGTHDDHGVHLLVRGTDSKQIEVALTRLETLVRERGLVPELLEAKAKS